MTEAERVLVAHASRYGSTAEIAHRVGSVLTACGAAVDVRRVETVDDVAGYDRIVVGGPIRYERWIPGAADFVRAHRSRLATTPVAFFFTCMALSKPGERSQEAAAGYERKIRSLAPEVEPLDVRGFAGVVDYAPMGVPTRLLMWTLLTLRGTGAGDHRDWIGIEAWARSLREPRRGLLAPTWRPNGSPSGVPHLDDEPLADRNRELLRRVERWPGAPAYPHRRTAEGKIAREARR